VVIFTINFQCPPEGSLVSLPQCLGGWKHRFDDYFRPALLSLAVHRLTGSFLCDLLLDLLSNNRFAINEALRLWIIHFLVIKSESRSQDWVREFLLTCLTLLDYYTDVSLIQDDTGNKIDTRSNLLHVQVLRFVHLENFVKTFEGHAIDTKPFSHHPKYTTGVTLLVFGSNYLGLYQRLFTRILIFFNERGCVSHMSKGFPTTMPIWHWYDLHRAIWDIIDTTVLLQHSNFVAVLY